MQRTGFIIEGRKRLASTQRGAWSFVQGMRDGRVISEVDIIIGACPITASGGISIAIHILVIC